MTAVVHNGKRPFCIQTSNKLTRERTAWRVDFNLSLSSFEPLIAGVRNLINLSAESPSSAGPRVLFVSSMGVLRSESQ